jgi:4-hydroxy-3-polyprenylbenzoate decarboxylase
MEEKERMSLLSIYLSEVSQKLASIPLIIVCDDTDFITEQFSNFIWVTFTRSNPSHDIYGVNERIEYKHWGCDVLIIDARIKPHHAPVLKKNPSIEARVDQILSSVAE